MPEKIKGQYRRYLKLSGPPADAERGIDAQAPFLDHPVAAVRTPAVKVSRGDDPDQRPDPKHADEHCTPPGILEASSSAASIGGETLQVSDDDGPARLAGSRVLYHRAPLADGKLTVLLGYGGHNCAKFDNFQIKKGPLALPGRAAGPVATSPAPVRGRRR